MFVEARTIVARSSARLLRYIDALQAPRDTTLLYALSSNAWDESIATRLSNVASRSVGCVSAPLPCLEGMAALSLGFLRDDESSTLLWTEPVAVDSADDWAAQAVGEHRHSGPAADDFTLDSPENSGDVHTVLSFSAKPASVTFHDALVRRFPHAAQTGLVGSHTPFVNGLPFTLFRNGAVHSAGAVAIAVRGRKRSRLTLDLDGFRAITAPVKVASARGNIVHTLGKDKATRHLLLAIHRAGLDTENSKDDEFYLALFPRDAVPPEGLLHVDASAYDAVLQINSGDPSRGSIAVESEWGPSTGDYVQILHRSLSSTPPRPFARDSVGQQLRLSATTLEQLHDGRERTPEEHIEAPGIFHACSENGFWTFSGARAPLSCAFPGATAALRWS